MKRFLAITLLLALMVGLIAACGSALDEPAVIVDDAEIADTQETDEPDESEEPEDDTEPGEVWQGGPTRGRWVDNMYVNEYLNLRFVMPHGWAAADDNEIAEVAGLGADVLAHAGHELGEAFWEGLDTFVLIDMLAVDPFTGVSVQVLYERLVFPFTRLTGAEYIQRSISEMGAIGSSDILPGTTRIGDYDWYAFRTVLDAFGGIVANISFVNVQDGFVRVIIISYNTTVMADPTGEILPRFSSLDVPPPPPEETPPAQEPEPLDEALLGAWAWEWDVSYVYVFEADGQGRRGFYPYLDEFTWRTYQSDHHLVLNIGFLVESWTYTIIGDVVTLDNRRIPGETFSYERWEGDFVPHEFTDFTDHPLIGTWAWDGDASYIYMFNVDETGIRGFPGQRIEFYWYAYDDHLMIQTDFGFESWTFTIDGDVLTIDSRQVDDMTWSYIRQ